MRNLVRLIIGSGLLAALGACGHGVSLIPHDGGEPGRGGQLVRGDSLSVRLDGKVYRGKWRIDGGDSEALAPTRVAATGPITVGRFYGQRGAGGGSVADFTAKDGSTLVCRFRYERGQDHGSGLCQSDKGRTFSLVVD